MDHPRSVLKLRQALRNILEEVDARHVIVAYSGGPDSLSLVHALAWEAPSFPIVCSAVTINHSVTSDSAERTRRAQELAEPLMPVVTIDVDIADGQGPEGSARHARYEAIADYARSRPGPALVLLGHTQDDQAETVLLGLARGSGPRSIAGMTRISTVPGAPDVLCARPFLGLAKATLIEALQSWKTPWVDDPTNSVDGQWRTASGDMLRRNALRHDGIPALSDALGDDVRPALARTADLLRRDLDFLDSHVWHIYESMSGPDLEIQPGQFHDAVETRLIRLWLLDQGARAGELSSTHIGAVSAVLGKPGKMIHLPGVNVVATDRGLSAR